MRLLGRERWDGLVAGRGEGGGARGAWGRDSRDSRGWMALDHGHDPQAHKPTSDDDETTPYAGKTRTAAAKSIKRTR
jgi:hypothetical protein